MLRAALLAALLAAGAGDALAAFTPVRPHDHEPAGRREPRARLDHFSAHAGKSGAQEFERIDSPWDGTRHGDGPRRLGGWKADEHGARGGNPYWRHHEARRDGGRGGRHDHEHNHGHDDRPPMLPCDEPYEPVPQVPLPAALVSFALGLGALAGALRRRGARAA